MLCQLALSAGGAVDAPADMPCHGACLVGLSCFEPMLLSVLPSVRAANWLCRSAGAGGAADGLGRMRGRGHTRQSQDGAAHCAGRPPTGSVCVSTSPSEAATLLASPSSALRSAIPLIMSSSWPPRLLYPEHSPVIWLHSSGVMSTADAWLAAEAVHAVCRAAGP